MGHFSPQRGSQGWRWAMLGGGVGPPEDPAPQGMWAALLVTDGCCSHPQSLRGCARTRVWLSCVRGDKFYTGVSGTGCGLALLRLQPG